jgi:hypothetical protein
LLYKATAAAFSITFVPGAEGQKKARLRRQWKLSGSNITMRTQIEGVLPVQGVLAKVSQQLSQLEKRDGELWMIVSLTGFLVTTGLLAIIFPAAFLKEGNIHFEITVSRTLVLGLMVLLALLNTYLLIRRLEIRRVRQELISRTIQQELIEQHYCPVKSRTGSAG